MEQSISSIPGPVEGSLPSPGAVKRRGWKKRLVLLAAGLIMAWLVVAYFVLPLLWVEYAHRHPSWEDVPKITHTVDDIPGDPLNVSLIGSKEEIMKLMVAAKYYPADPLTLRSCLRIAEAAVLKRPYDDAPVSNLYLFGRKEDLAFEQPVNNNPRRRHHVRFWKSENVDDDGRPIWMGATTYDERVGLSHTTGEITHHIAPDVDAERDHLFAQLQQTSRLDEVYFVDDFHKTLKGKNGGGDPWHTDGRLAVGVLREGGAAGGQE